MVKEVIEQLFILRSSSKQPCGASRLPGTAVRHHGRGRGSALGQLTSCSWAPRLEGFKFSSASGVAGSDRDTRPARLRLWGPGSETHPQICFSLQFDLQRIVIYCDSRHAELETCCDIPTGPVSKASCTGRLGGNRSFASRRPGMSGA